MNEWIHGRMNGYIDELMDTWINEWIHGRMNGQTTE